MNKDEIKRIKINLSEEEINLLQNLDDSVDELLAFFKILKSKNWIKYTRNQDDSDGLLGNIFEDFLGLTENNLRMPDYKNIELKTKNINSQSFVSLFSVRPNSCKNIPTILREKYGSPEEEGSPNILNTRVLFEKWNTHRNGYSFKLSKLDNKLFINIKSISSEELLDNFQYYWNIDDIEKIFNSKIKNSAYITGEINKETKMVKFEKINIFKNADFKKFIELLKNNDICVEFRIGVYKSGIKKGKTHDHGTAFRIKKSNFSELYIDEIFEIDEDLKNNN